MLPTTNHSLTNHSSNSRYDFLVDLANTLKAFLGLNFIVVAYGFSKAGLLRGVIGLVFLVFVTEHCCLLLIQVKNSLYQPLPTHTPPDSDNEEIEDQLQHQSCSNKSLQQPQQPRQPQNAPTFGDIAFRVAGKKAELFITACVILTQFGYCVGYLIFISQTLHDLLSATVAIPYFILIPLPIVLAIALLQSIRSLGPFSAFANGALLFGFIAVVAFIIRHFNWTPTKVPLSSFPMFFGQMTAAIEGIGLVVPLEASMRNKKNFQLILRIALTIITIILMVVGVLGFATFGADTHSIILLNFGQSPIVVAVKSVLVIGILFTYPLQIIPVFEFAERMFLNDNSGGATDLRNQDGQLPKSSHIHSTNSSTSTQLPINDSGTDLSNTSSLFQTLDDDDERVESHKTHNKSDTVVEIEREEYDEASEVERGEIEDGDESIFLRDRRRISIRLGIVMSTAVTAVVAGASFGVFNALVGSLGASMLAYTAPAVFHNIVMGENLTTAVRVKNWMIALMGVMGAVSGTYASLKEILDIHAGRASPG